MARDSKTWRCGRYELKFDRPRIMGILNVTPDSFSDGGAYLDPDAAIAHGLQMLDDGADIIDIGGESTRPGFNPVSADEEAKRVLPVIRELVAHGAIVSIDTRHVDVAKAAVRMGASIVNDVTGFTDAKMVEFVKTNTCGIIIMHAGEIIEPVRTHTAVQLDTSAAAFVAEKAREAAERDQKGTVKKLVSNAAAKAAEKPIQSALPLEDGAAGAIAIMASTEGAAAVASEEASLEAAPDSGGESAEAVEAEQTQRCSESAGSDAPVQNDRLADIMRRSARREEAYVETSQLRRFTLPDSAPIMRRVMGFLSDQARALMHAGVDRDRICIDPGAGFGKTINEDIIVIRETAKIASLGYPLLCAVSRKRFVGTVADIDQADQRDAATFGMCLGAIENGANIVRVHDVAGFAQFLNGFWAAARPQPRRAFVSLGSNLGRRMENIRNARDFIAEIPLTCVSNCSRIYESEPAYERRQDDYANAVIEIKTELSALVLLHELLEVENKLGRNRSRSARPNGPRVIDCDLLWMDGENHGGDRLRLPHPKLGERDFVLVPLEDLMHDPARFFRYEGVDVLEPEQRVGHVTGELGAL